MKLFFLITLTGSALVAGCASPPASPGGDPAPEWHVGDLWSWDVQTENASWKTTHTVVGTTAVRGTPVYEVLSTTTSASSVVNRTLYFAKNTLNEFLVGCDDPGERPVCVFEKKEFDFPLRANETWTFVTGGSTAHEARASQIEDNLWRLDYVGTEYECPKGCFFQFYDPAVRHLTYRETGPNTIFGVSPMTWRLVEDPN